MIDHPREFLLIHGWRQDPNFDAGRGLWNHPHDIAAHVPDGPPMTDWLAREAVDIELLNQRWRLLKPLGWNVEMAGIHDHNGGVSYYSSITRVRSAIGSNGRRRFSTVAHAFARQRGEGWPGSLQRPPKLATVRCEGKLFIWCLYCGAWHSHGANGERVRASAGHRVAHCTGRTPYSDSGYYLQVAIVVDRLSTKRAA